MVSWRYRETSLRSSAKERGKGARSKEQRTKSKEQGTRGKERRERDESSHNGRC